MASIGFLVASLALPYNWVSPHDAFDAVAIAALGVFGGLGHYCLVRAFELALALFVSPFNYAQIVGAAALGFSFFGQLPDAPTFLGTLVIIGSGMFFFFAPRTISQSSDQ